MLCHFLSRMVSEGVFFLGEEERGDWDWLGTWVYMYIWHQAWSLRVMFDALLVNGHIRFNLFILYFCLDAFFYFLDTQVNQKKTLTCTNYLKSQNFHSTKNLA